jgi:hypothetical protein
VRVGTTLRVLPTDVPVGLGNSNLNGGVQRFVNEENEEKDGCIGGYPCGGRILGLPSPTASATPTTTE